MKRLLAVAAIVLWVAVGWVSAHRSAMVGQAPPYSLDIYFLDMVGGASTLIVTPLGESVLIDTGSLEPKHRDADRIIEACRYAGLKHIDYLITTHFHSDHFGAILEVSESIPIQ